MDLSCFVCTFMVFRRPEITIVSAEPLASNSWFPPASVDFNTPPLLPPLPPQPGWSAGIQADSQVQQHSCDC